MTNPQHSALSPQHTSEVITFGCRLNAYESQVIKDNLNKAGAENTVVFNTCAVTKEAERQARGEDVLTEAADEEDATVAAEALFEEGAAPKAEGESEEAE